MDTTSLMISMLFGSIGFGFIMYGRKAAKMIPIAAGGLIMVCTYLIPDIPAQLIVCSIITAVPFVLRNG
jgi:hypothetical protein